jgi:alpha-mannosidase
MKYDNLAILLTCHSLEDFPVHHEGDEADSLLANWTALWHPKLIADAQKLPTWIRTFDVPEDCAGHLFLSPISSDNDLQTGFAQRVTEQAGKLIRRHQCRDEILKLVLADLPTFQVDEELVADFLALGYCYLQIQLLTRQLRYSSNLDDVYFTNLVVEGASAAVSAENDVAKSKLQSAFDLLMEERDNYYPVNALLLDLTLTAETTLGKRLVDQLKYSTTHTNLLMTAGLLEKAVENQDIKDGLSLAGEKNLLTVVGGTETEARFPLLSAESVFDEFARGKIKYLGSHFGKVDFFGRRRYGLSPFLPQVLEHFGFKGGFHFTLDDGRFPEGMQVKSFWEGDGEAKIEVFGKLPVDANSSGSFLNLGVKIGESFDMDHAAAICFVHWPGQNCVWYDDLKRISQFGAVLGKFVSTTEFLNEMEEPYQHDRFTADQYHSPFLKQAVIRNQPDPVSRSMDYWRRVTRLDTAKTLDFLTTVFSGAAERTGEIQMTRGEIIAAFESNEENSFAAMDDRLDALVTEKSTALVAALVNGHSQSDDASHEGIEKTIVINPNSQVYRQGTFLESDIATVIDKPIYGTSQLERGESLNKHVVCDVPSVGYAVLGSANSGEAIPGDRGQRSGGVSKSNSSLLVDELTIRNEFIEVIIDQATGGIRALHDYKTRGNRLSQVLAYRGKSKHEQQRFAYSEMKLDSIRTTANSTTFGEIVTEGKLIWDGQSVAGFRQAFSLFKGSRVVEVAVEFFEAESPKSDPWNCYFGSRFAYNDESSTIWTTRNQTRQASSSNRLESPHYIDLENAKSRTSILTGGVPWHVRRGDRYVDSIYIVKGESRRQFRFGVGVDLPNPLLHALELGTSPLRVTTRGDIRRDYCWLFHFDSKNIWATSWEPVFENGNSIGFRVRILETMGRETKCKLSAFRDIREASRIRADHEKESDIEVENGSAVLKFSPNQFIECEVLF